MSIVQSCKGKDQLLLDGYRYRHTNKSLINWRCVKHNCNGSAMFDGAQYVKLNDHIHPPNPDEVIAAEFKSKIQQRATTSYDPPRRIIHEALLNVHKDDALALPSYAASQRLIGRKRKKNNISLPNPTCFQDIVIPDQLKLTNSGDRFLLYDNEDNDSRIIILSSDDDLKRLSQCDHWHADGTFRVAPQLFYQLYTLHGVIRGRSLPCVYAILPGKSESVYDKLFHVILQHVTKHPRSISIDYEKAVENIVKRKMPACAISGCFFHLKKALWKKIQSLGLQQKFVDNREIRHNLKDFACLSLIPETFVVEEFERIQEESSDEINDFIDYFEDNYVGRRIRNDRRRTPRFQIKFWNCYSRLQQRLPRSNNSSEGWHHALNNSARANPSIYESIKDLQMEQHANLIMAERLDAGIVKLTKRIEYEQMDEQLQSLAASFSTITRKEYFKRARALFNF
ncbi:unnamed protein product [Rotaria sp. Silwood2]|nr:unnamed protein product [Rotaria sp. Silwood2]